MVCQRNSSHMMKNNPFFNPYLLLVLLVLGSCSNSDEPGLDCSTSDISLSIVNTINESCNQANGVVQVTASGTGAIISIDRPNSPFTNDAGGGTFTGLPAGFYSITLQDANGCFITDTTTVGNDPSMVVISLDSMNSGCTTSNGSITATVSNATDPVQYSLDGGGFQSGESFTGLSAGSYTVLARDADGCESSASVEVLSGTSYLSNIKPLIEASCAIANCHDGNTPGLPDWSSLANVQDNKDNIKQRTGDGSMPPASQDPLTQEQKDAIACWVDDGALDN